MEPYDLALVELLDHLGRRASRQGIPAPRSGDRIGDWCRADKDTEAHLRAYLDKQYPGWLGGDDTFFYGVSFAELVRALVR